MCAAPPAGKRPLAVVLFACLLMLVVVAGDGALAGVQSHAMPAPVAVALPAARYGVALRYDLSYGPLSEETLDLCSPEGAQGPRPGVILIHGGGWVQGDKRDFAADCAYLASQGFVAVTVGYRLAPAAAWPAPLVDVQLAVRALRAHADEYGLDPTRLCALGFSAGGHLAVFLGVLAGIHPGDEAALYADQSPMVGCVVDESGPTDLTARFSPAFDEHFLLPLFGGATRQAAAALYREASPLFAVSRQAAPTLIVQGERDDIVPAEQAHALRQALRLEGVPVEYIGYDGTHGLGSLASVNEQHEIERRVVRFLTTHAGLHG
jgi:acetyl esterase/lipase